MLACTVAAGDPMAAAAAEAPEASLNISATSPGLASFGGDESPPLKSSAPVPKPTFDSVGQATFRRRAPSAADANLRACFSSSRACAFLSEAGPLSAPQQVTELPFPDGDAALSAPPARSISGGDGTSLDEGVSVSPICEEAAATEVTPTRCAPSEEGNELESCHGSLLEEVLEWVEDTAVATALMVRVPLLCR